MKFTSTRSNVEADSLYTVLRGLAPDGGLYVPKSVKALDPSAIASIKSLADAERLALGAIFDDIPAEVREDAIANLLAKFPAENPIPLVEADSALGFEASMLYVTDRRHLEWKLRQIDFVVNIEMRQMRDGLALHLENLAKSKGDQQ